MDECDQYGKQWDTDQFLIGKRISTNVFVPDEGRGSNRYMETNKSPRKKRKFVTATKIKCENFTLYNTTQFLRIMGNVTCHGKNKIMIAKGINQRINKNK